MSDDKKEPDNPITDEESKIIDVLDEIAIDLAK